MACCSVPTPPAWCLPGAGGQEGCRAAEAGGRGGGMYASLVDEHGRGMPPGKIVLDGCRELEGPEEESSSDSGCCSGTCCLRCCGGCFCFLFLVLLAVLIWVIPGLPGIFGGYIWCQITTCLNIFEWGQRNTCSEDYEVKLASTPLGVNNLPLAYFVDGYFDQKQYKLSSVGDWDSVKRLGAELPKRTWEGEWWRGNELSYVVNNPFFWSQSGIVPASVSLGITTQQHAAIRPILEEAFLLTNDMQQWVRKSLRDFLEARKKAGSIKVPDDLRGWVHRVLYQVVFDEEIWRGDAVKFSMVQGALLRKSDVSQAMPSSLYGIFGYKDLAATANKEILQYQELLEARWARDLAAVDCSPSPSCSLQLASAVWDALYAIGGASVPAGIAAGLGVLYSSSGSNPARDFTIPEGKEPEFFWECLRYFPPVHGVPYWTTRPTCAGLSPEETLLLNKTGGMTEPCPVAEAEASTGEPPVNQWLGGQRHVLDIGRAQRDKSRWGPDADQFVLRSLKNYNNNSLGFAEMAVDETVAQGGNDRSCPAKQLAIAIGAIFFEEFGKVKENWAPSTTDIAMDPFQSSEQVEPFELLPQHGMF